MKNTVAVLFVVFLFLPVRAEAVVKYTITDLGTDRGVYGINNQGQVVGTYSNGGAFLYTDGNIQILPVPPSTSANAINNRGQIVGGSWLYSNGVTQYIHCDEAFDINDNGQIVGSDKNHAFLYENGIIRDLGTFFGDNYSYATAINYSGQIAGVSYDIAPDHHDSHAFLYTEGTLQNIGSFGGAYSFSSALNNSGQVVGSSTTINGDQHAFLYSEATLKDLGTLGGKKSFASSINNNGQIVGNAYNCNDLQHAFLYSDGVMQDLNDLIDPSSGWILTGTNAINDKGQIIGWGANTTHDGGETWGENFLLTPIPEPSTLALLSMGGIWLIAWTWRRRKANRILVCFISLLCLSVGMSHAVTIDLVPVGNAGNEGEQSRLYASDQKYYGGVTYDFQIGKYELTNPQYCEFLNAKAKSDPYGLYNDTMSFLPNGGITRSGSTPNYSYAVKSGYENMPVTLVGWYDAVRYANWMTNGQGDGDTESGSYTITEGRVNFGKVVTPTATERAAWAAGNKHYWLLPTENEWYKAAYHKNDGVTNHFWKYATATNADPYSDIPAGLNYPANSANYANDDGITNGFNDGYAATGSTVYDQLNINYLTNVGAYSQSTSPYGTFDQNGNVAEWNETKIGSAPIVSGGAWNNSIGVLASSARGTVNGEGDPFGFRLVLSQANPAWNA